MDFYMTKYQGKPMEALTPLFQSMLRGVHRLTEQERDEKAEADAAAAQNEEPAAKKRKTQDDLKRRARRLTIRLAPWLIVTTGAPLQKSLSSFSLAAIVCRPTATNDSSPGSCNGPAKSANAISTATLQWTRLRAGHSR